MKELRATSLCNSTTVKTLALVVYAHCGFRFNKDEVMEMDFQAYLASSDEECDNDEVWPAKGNKNLTEEERIVNYRVRSLLLIWLTLFLFDEMFVK